ncbi:MAG: extracellular solute-binding protein [Streptococcaceae bacterium]|jgi:multiple sugar transport system substrate-binding protein|nr:extracellular solute-binding protein [Streptococcaceae bacterium]
MKLHKKLILGAAITALAALGLAGCSSGGKAEDKSSGSQTLKVAVWDYKTIPEFKALFDAFEDKNPGVKIEPVDIPSASYEQKITTMLSGGDKTDVLAMKTLASYSSYATRNQLVDLSDHIKDLDKEPAQSVYDMYKIDGKTYAQPYRQDFWVLYYNTKLLKEAGITDVSNMTWDDYVKYAKELTDSSKGIYGSYQHTWRSVLQATAAGQNDKNILTPPYEYFKPYYERTLELQKDKAIMDYGTAKSTQVTYASQFGTEKAAMMPMGTWYMATVNAAKAKGDATAEWSIAPMPQNEKGEVTTFGSPTAWAISKHSANSKLAQKFLDYASGKDGAKVLAKIGVVPAYRTSEIDDIYFNQKGMPTDEVAKKAFNPDKISLEVPIDAKASEIDQALQQEHELILTGSESVDKGIDNMNKRVAEIKESD